MIWKHSFVLFVVGCFAIGLSSCRVSEDRSQTWVWHLDGIQSMDGSEVILQSGERVYLTGLVVPWPSLPLEFDESFKLFFEKNLKNRKVRVFPFDPVALGLRKALLLDEMGNMDIGHYLIEHGWALADDVHMVGWSAGYKRAEASAMNARAGIWKNPSFSRAALAFMNKPSVQ